MASHDDGSGQDPRVPPAARHSHPAGPSGPAPSGGSAGPSGPAPRGPGGTTPAIDPELLDDLGAEFEFRGDVLDAEVHAAHDEAQVATDELQVTREECVRLRDDALRARAEFDNYRKRITREREEDKRRAGERLVGEMLPAIDNLERAIAHAEGGGDLSHLLGGVESVYDQLLGVLRKEGVEVIDPKGQRFDPLAHQAVSQLEDTSVPEGTVVEVFQKGYALPGRVLREATVVVSTGGPPFEE